MKKFTIKYCNSFDTELRKETWTGENKLDAYMYAAGQCKSNETRITVIDDSEEERLSGTNTKDIENTLISLLGGQTIESMNEDYSIYEDCEISRFSELDEPGDGIVFRLANENKVFSLKIEEVEF